jgi:hypothetical protein
MKENGKHEMWVNRTLKTFTNNIITYLVASKSITIYKQSTTLVKRLIDQWTCDRSTHRSDWSAVQRQWQTTANKTGSTPEKRTNTYEKRSNVNRTHRKTKHTSTVRRIFRCNSSKRSSTTSCYKIAHDDKQNEATWCVHQSAVSNHDNHILTLIADAQSVIMTTFATRQLQYHCKWCRATTTSTENLKTNPKSHTLSDLNEHLWCDKESE